MSPACSSARGQDGNGTVCKTVDSGFDSRPRVQLSVILDRVHAALRGIDAADQTRAIPDKQLDAVSDAVTAIETFCHAEGIPLSEFASTHLAETCKNKGGRVHWNGSCIDCGAEAGEVCRRSITKSDSAVSS